MPIVVLEVVVVIVTVEAAFSAQWGAVEASSFGERPAERGKASSEGCDEMRR